MLLECLEHRPQQDAQRVRRLRELEVLLAAHDEAGSFIESPALELAGPNLTSKARGATLVGQQIGGYRILSLLGAGGMGEVYRVRADRREIGCLLIRV